MTAEELAVLKKELSESKALVEKHQETIRTLNQDKDSLTNKRTDLEKRIATLEIEYEELLEKSIADEEHDANVQDTISELKVCFFVCLSIKINVLLNCVQILTFILYNNDILDKDRSTICNQERNART